MDRVVDRAVELGSVAAAAKDGGDRVAEVAGGAARRVSERSKSVKKKRKHYTGRSRGTDELRRLEEARSKLAEFRDKLGPIARDLMRSIYGEDGPVWGTSFRDIEILAALLGDHLAARFVQDAVSEQASHVPPESQVCPVCAGPGTPSQEDEPRSLQTLRGIVNWGENKCTCGSCRRDFFPSEPRLED